MYAETNKITSELFFFVYITFLIINLDGYECIKVAMISPDIENVTI
jgi:hypothetical protein